jgi:hypothetical protein
MSLSSPAHIPIGDVEHAQVKALRHTLTSEGCVSTRDTRTLTC